MACPRAGATRASPPNSFDLPGDEVMKSRSEIPLGLGLLGANGVWLVDRTFDERMRVETRRLNFIYFGYLGKFTDSRVTVGEHLTREWMPFPGYIWHTINGFEVSKKYHPVAKYMFIDL